MEILALFLWLMLSPIGIGVFLAGVTFVFMGALILVELIAALASKAKGEG